MPSTIWEELRFDGETPVGTLLRFRVRTAATRAEPSRARAWIIGRARRRPATSPIDLRDRASMTAMVDAPDGGSRSRCSSRRCAMSFDPDRPITPRLRSVTVTRTCPPALD
jgi:hypothetical protein